VLVALTRIGVGTQGGGLRSKISEGRLNAKPDAQATDCRRTDDDRRLIILRLVSDNGRFPYTGTIGGPSKIIAGEQTAAWIFPEPGSAAAQGPNT